MFTIVIFRIFTFVNMIKAETFFNQYPHFKNREIHGRYLSRSILEPQLKILKSQFEVKTVGYSFLNLPIEVIKAGSGAIKILAWSQMHGNESTTTKGVLDIFNFFSHFKEDPQVGQILDNITLWVIPMLNPDGADRYTRENVNGTDLNRDALNLKEPESRVLRKCFTEFSPDFCLNLHDQRTIFGAGDEPYPATLSFLAPSMDVDRSVTGVRKKAMQVIAAMNQALQQVIPHQIGRFDDGFNINCSGDYFQSQNVPTILFECGHYQEDYLREKTREFFTFSLLTALDAIASGSYLQQDYRSYFNIPENRKSFYDIILRNARMAGERVDIAIQYSERIKSGEVNFLPVVTTMAPHLSFYGHKEIDCKGAEVEKLDETPLVENDIVEAILLNKEKLLIK